MFKPLVTLVRGRVVAIGEEVADQNALAILDQQMRDAAGALDRAKKALAVAIAQESQEGQRLDATRARIVCAWRRNRDRPGQAAPDRQQPLRSNHLGLADRTTPSAASSIVNVRDPTHRISSSRCSKTL